MSRSARDIELHILAAKVIENWMQTARDEVEDIQTWRDELSERLWHGGWPEPPKLQNFNTPYLCGWIATHHANLDTSPLLDISAAITAWHADHNADRLPTREALEALLERALTITSAAMFAIQGRLAEDHRRKRASAAPLSKGRSRIPTRERGGPKERIDFYKNPDLYALDQWKGGLEVLLRGFAEGTDQPDEGIWIVFRPTAEANTAIIKFSAKYPIPIGHLEEARKWTEEAFDRFIAQDNQETRDALHNALDILLRRATATVETIESVEIDGMGKQEIPPPKTEHDPGLSQWDALTEARNKWIYESCMKLVSYSTILYELKVEAPSRRWDVITSIPGLKRAAKAYATRKKLTPPPVRKAPPRGE